MRAIVCWHFLCDRACVKWLWAMLHSTSQQSLRGAPLVGQKEERRKTKEERSHNVPPHRGSRTAGGTGSL